VKKENKIQDKSADMSTPSENTLVNLCLEKKTPKENEK
jgi:hypothetical protein